MDVEDEELLVGIVTAGVAIQELEHGIDMDVAAHAATRRNRVRPVFFRLLLAPTRERAPPSVRRIAAPLSRTPLWR
jgi:hypothetical protein